MNTPKCNGCKHLNIYGSTHGGVRGLCYCGHRKAHASFERYSNGSKLIDWLDANCDDMYEEARNNENE